MGVQTQESRDEKTVAIATGLGLFCLVMAALGLVQWAVSALLDVSDPTLRASSWTILAVAGLVLGWHLRRGSRR